MDERGGTDGALRLLSAAVSAVSGQDEAEALLTDLLTPREIAELARRLEVARLLAQGTPYTGVSRTTGASSTTVSRVSKCLTGGAGGYRLVLERLADDAR